MIGQDFLYFIHDDQQRFYYVDQYFTVSFSTTPKPLEFSPDGWQEISILTELNKKYFGFERSFTIPLNFVEDGGKIIKNLYYTQGIEGKLYLLILEQKISIDSTTYGFYYDYLYRGEIALETFNHAGAKVTCNCVEGGLTKLIKANESTLYEIPIDSQAINIKMDGIVKQQSATYILTNGLLADNLGGHIIALNLVGIESISSINAVDENRVKTGNSAANLWGTNERFILGGTGDTLATFTWDFYMTPSLASGVGAVFGTSIFLQVHTVHDDSTSTSTNIQAKGGGDPILLYNQKLHFSGTATVPILAGRRVILYMSASQNRDFTYFQYDINAGSFTAKYTYRHGITYIKAFRGAYVLQQLVSKMTEGKYLIDSDLLKEVETYVLTPGDAIRRLPGAKIKTSLAQFFNSFNVRFNVGMGVLNDKLKFEHKEYWFDGVSTIDLGEVSGLKITPANDLIFNSVKVGYPAQDYNNSSSPSINGRDEFNTTQIYTTPITRITKELTLVSDYRADMHGIEDLRINLDGKLTADSSSDNDTFFIKVTATPSAYLTSDNSPIYDLDRTLNAGATGLIDATSAFNIALSPKRCLFAHNWFMASFLDKLGMKWVRFQTTDKNAGLIAGGVRETGDFVIGDIPGQRFHPVLLEFETRVPENLQTLLDANPVRQYQGTYQGAVFKGIALKSGIEPSTNKTQVYQLLCSADTDLLQFINVNE